VNLKLQTLLCVGLAACGGAAPEARPTEPAAREAQALALYEAMLVRDLDGDALEARQLRTELAAGWSDTRAGRLAAESTESVLLELALIGTLSAALPQVLGGDLFGSSTPPEVVEPLPPEPPPEPVSVAPPPPTRRKSKTR
jgi:hypothetical protein